MVFSSVVEACLDYQSLAERQEEWLKRAGEPVVAEPRVRLPREVSDLSLSTLCRMMTYTIIGARTCAINPGETTMKKIFIACVALSISAAAAFAAPAAQAPAAATAPAAKTAQQSKMTTCNADAAGKKGDERKAFMKTCLSAPAAAAPMTQQQKMKSCNADATGKKGDERKAFMKSCLSAAH
jgi:hypothetical protein